MPTVYNPYSKDGHFYNGPPPNDADYEQMQYYLYNIRLQADD